MRRMAGRAWSGQDMLINRDMPPSCARVTAGNVARDPAARTLCSADSISTEERGLNDSASLLT